MAHAGWRLLVVAAAVVLAGLQLLLSQSETGAAAAAGSIASTNTNASAHSVNAWDPPGCVQIVGAPPFPSCEPCPPLWLGGPTIRCIVKPSPAIRFAPPALGFGVLVGRRCPGLPRWAMGAGDSMLVTRLCAYSAGE